MSSSSPSCVDEPLEAAATTTQINHGEQHSAAAVATAADDDVEADGVLLLSSGISPHSSVSSSPSYRVRFLDQPVNAHAMARDDEEVEQDMSFELPRFHIAQPDDSPASPTSPTSPPVLSLRPPRPRLGQMLSVATRSATTTRNLFAASAPGSANASAANSPDISPKSSDAFQDGDDPRPAARVTGFFGPADTANKRASISSSSSSTTSLLPLCLMSGCGKHARPIGSMMKGYCKVHFSWLLLPRQSAHQTLQSAIAAAQVLSSSPFTLNLIASNIPPLSVELQSLLGFCLLAGSALVDKARMGEWELKLKQLEAERLGAALEAEQASKSGGEDVAESIAFDLSGAASSSGMERTTISVLSFFCTTLYHVNSTRIKCSCPNSPCPLFTLRSLWATNLMYSTLRPFLTSDNDNIRIIALRIVFRFFQIFHNSPFCQLYHTLHGRDKASILQAYKGKSISGAASAVISPANSATSQASTQSSESEVKSPPSVGSPSVVDSSSGSSGPGLTLNISLANAVDAAAPVTAANGASKSVVLNASDYAALDLLQYRHQYERLNELIIMAAGPAAALKDIMLDSLFQLLTDRIPSSPLASATCASPVPRRNSLINPIRPCSPLDLPQPVSPVDVDDEEDELFPEFPVANLGVDLFSSPIRNPVLLPSIYAALKGSRFAIRTNALKNLFSALVSKPSSAEYLLKVAHWQTHIYQLLIDLPRPGLTRASHHEAVASGSGSGLATRSSSPILTPTAQAASGNAALEKDALDLNAPAAAAPAPAPLPISSSPSLSSSYFVSPMKSSRHEFHQYLLGILRQTHLYAFQFWQGQKFHALLLSTIRLLHSFTGVWNCQSIHLTRVLLLSMVQKFREPQLLSVLRNGTGTALWVNLQHFCSIVIQFMFFTPEGAISQQINGSGNNRSSQSQPQPQTHDDLQLNPPAKSSSRLLSVKKSSMTGASQPGSKLPSRKNSLDGSNNGALIEAAAAAASLAIPGQAEEGRKRSKSREKESAPATIGDSLTNAPRAFFAKIFAAVGSKEAGGSFSSPGQAATPSPWSGPVGVNAAGGEEPLYFLTPAADAGLPQLDSPWSDTLSGPVFIHSAESARPFKCDDLPLLSELLALLQMLGIDKFDPKHFPGLDKEEIDMTQNVVRLYELLNECREIITGTATAQTNKDAQEATAADGPASAFSVTVTAASPAPATGQQRPSSSQPPLSSAAVASRLNELMKAKNTRKVLSGIKATGHESAPTAAAPSSAPASAPGSASFGFGVLCSSSIEIESRLFLSLNSSKEYFFRLTHSHLVYNKGNKYKHAQATRVPLDNLCALQYSFESAGKLTHYCHIGALKAPLSLISAIASAGRDEKANANSAPSASPALAASAAPLRVFAFQINTASESHIVHTEDESLFDSWLNALSFLISLIRSSEGRIGEGLFGLADFQYFHEHFSVQFPEALDLFNQPPNQPASPRAATSPRQAGPRSPRGVNSIQFSSSQLDDLFTPRSSLFSAVAPIMVQKKSVTHCANPECRAQFGLFRLARHCYMCGQVFCPLCLKHKVALPNISKSEEKRVCDKDFQLLEKKQSAKFDQLARLAKLKLARSSVLVGSDVDASLFSPVTEQGKTANPFTQAFGYFSPRKTKQ